MKLTNAQKELIQNELSAVVVERLFDDYLDEIYGTVSIAGLDGYLTSELLKNTDPTAYRVKLADYTDTLLEDDLIEIDGLYYWTNEANRILEEVA